MNTTPYKHTPCYEATVAWTGGSHPKPYDECHPMERKLVDSLYRAQYDSFCAFWGKAPDGPTCELYKTRARYDAHATIRAGAFNGAIFGAGD